MTNLGRIATETGTFVFGVDHFGKATETGTRGSSAKEGSADVVLALLGSKEVSGKVTNTRLAVRKNRDGESGREYPFTAPVVEMGHDQLGNSVTTRIIEWGKKEERAATGASAVSIWTGAPLKLLRRILMTELVDRAETPAGDTPTMRGVDLEIIRREFYKGYFVDGADQDAKKAAKQKAFKRAVNAAQQGGLVGIDENDLGQTVIWLTRKGEDGAEPGHAHTEK